MTLPRYPKYKDSGVPWLGEVPEDWAVKPIKAVASINDEALPETTDQDYEMDYVDIGSVSLGAGIEKIEHFSFKEAPSRARRIVRDGDVIVSTVRTYLKAIAPITAPPENLIVSTGFAVVRPKPALFSGFAKYGL
jgi:type I restriction enzyme S subunit